PGEFFGEARGVRVEVVGRVLQHLGALRYRCFPPYLEPGARRFQGGARVVGSRGGEASDDVARVGRVDVVERAPARGRDPLAADEVLELGAHACSSPRSAAGTWASAMFSSESGRS